MRLNNGTVLNSASSAKGGGIPRQNSSNMRFEISDDLLHATTEDSSDEDPSWSPRQPLGKGVNDLRNGRSATPSSIYSEGTIRTRQSVASDQRSRASTSISQRSAKRRKEVLAAKNEPHPYGLESTGKTLAKSITRGSPSPSRNIRVVEEVVHRRETVNHVVFNNGIVHHAHLGNHNYIEDHNERVHRSGFISSLANANNKSISNVSTKYQQSNDNCMLSSDSETYSNNEADNTDPNITSASLSFAFSSVWHYLKKIVSSVCTCIYLFIVGIFVLEKWCLHTKRREDERHNQYENLQQRSQQHFQYHQQNSNLAGDQNGGNYPLSSDSELDEQEHRHETGENYTHHSYYSSVMNQGLFSSVRKRCSSLFSSSSADAGYSNVDNENTNYISDDEDDAYAERNNIRHQSNTIYTGVVNSFLTSSQSCGSAIMTGLKGVQGKSWSFFRNLMRLLLVILLLLLLWQYGSDLLAFIIAGWQRFLYAVFSAFDVASNGIFNAVCFISTLQSSKNIQAAQPMLAVSTPSSVATEPGYIAAIPIAPTTTIIKQDSEETLAALKLTQASIDNLKLQIASMENMLKEHGVRLNAHDQSFGALQSQIEIILAASKAASAKEKPLEQIIEEILNASVGETTDGSTVTLKGLFAILEQKADRERISKEIETKLKIISDDLGKMTAAYSDEVDGLKVEVFQMNSRFEKMEQKIAEQQKTVEPEVDIEKLKAAILPILTSEIHASVATSCVTRNCPEGLSLAGLSTEDIELMIKRAIAKYDADKTGLPDLALESAGGSILSTRCTKSSELRNSVISYWGFRLWSPPNTPRTIIQPGVVPGECWAFEGSVGDVVIKLAVPAIVTAFTLEHIPKSTSRYEHIDSAPKHFQVLGLQSEHDTVEVHDYGSFVYEDNNEPLQYFPVINATARYYPIVELKILSNHGNMHHTCIYRFRVHGAIDLTRSQNGGGGVVMKTKSSTQSTEESNKSNSN